VVERLFLDDGRNLGTPAHARNGLVGDDSTVRLLDGGDEGVLVERLQRAWIEDLYGDPLLRGLLCRLERLVHEPAGSDDGHILALAMDPRLADLDRLDLVGNLALDA